MELPSFLVTLLPQPEPVQKPKEEEIGKQYPVNSSHFSPYKNYIKHSAFAKRTTLHPALSLDPLQRAKEVLTDMHYSFGRVHPVQPILSSFHAGKLAPGPCSPNLRAPMPPFPGYSEDQGTVSLEKGFAKVKVQLPALQRPVQLLSKSTSPRAAGRTTTPILTTADRERLRTAFQTRLKSLKTSMTRRVRNTVSKHHKHHIFPEDVNDFRAQTSVNSAIEYR